MTETPPLLALAQGRRARPRKAQIARPKEILLAFRRRETAARALPL
jgi:hypothetical protein